jgi:hypothetical protein
MIVGRHFERERVMLGGKGFERCVFLGCELVFDGRPVRLVNNMLKDCCWSFEGAAGVTLDFIASLCRDDDAMRSMFAQELGLAKVGHAAREALSLH